jgi:Fe-S cluster biosynthesis and repair protein YggX
MMNLEHRKLLEEQMQKFLFEGEAVEIEGYVPQAKS